MRVFAYEYVTGGGLAGEPLPASLAREGDLMLRALLRDLADVPGVEAFTLRDARLPPLPDRVPAQAIADPAAARQRFAAALEEADDFWPVAPETGGILEALSRAALERGCRLLGSRPDALAIAASKWATARCLGAAGIPAADAHRPDEALPEGMWVVKPDDGAGCDETWLCPTREAARARLRGNAVAQRFVPGEAASLSLLCRDGDARLLSVNRQRVEVRDGRFRYRGGEVNGLRDDGALRSLGQGVAAALPGLWGYVGIDLVLSAEGPVVIEVNPRLTLSYGALRAALGVNPAAQVLALDEGFPLPPPAGVPVAIDLEGGDDDGG